MNSEIKRVRKLPITHKPTHSNNNEEQHETLNTHTTRPDALIRLSIKTEQLKKEVTALQEEIACLQLSTDTERSKLKPKRRTKGSEAQVGDRVQILNNYRGRKGDRGVVIRTTASQVTINPDNGGENYRRYKGNIKIIYDNPK